MNFKGWKKTGEDHHIAHFTHENGSELKIAKSALSKKHLGELGRLELHKARGYDEGGKVQSDQAGAPIEQSPSGSGIGGIPLAQAENQPPPPGPTPIAPQQIPQGQQQLTPQQDYQRGYNETMAKHAAEFGKEDALFGQDIANGHITPKTYGDIFANRSTPGKIGTLFGLLLSGAGSGITGQENAVLKMMQKEIDNDLDAQKTSKSNAMEYIKTKVNARLANAQLDPKSPQGRKLAADAEAAELLNLKNKKGLAILNHLTSLNSKLPPEQQAKGQQVINGVLAPATDGYIQDNNNKAAHILTESEFQQRNNDLRMADAFGALSGGNHLADTAEAHHYPGIPGQSSRPLTGSDTQFLDSGINFDKQLNAFKSWAKAHSGDLKPEDIKTGRAMAAELQGAYRQATNGGVFKEGEQNFISSIIDSNPTKFFNEIRVLPQLDVIEKDNKRRMHTKLKGLGFEGGYPGYKETKWVGGKEYEQGPKDEMIPVK